MRAFVLGVACMLVISGIAAVVLNSLDYSSATTYTSQNNSVRLSDQ